MTRRRCKGRYPVGRVNRQAPPFLQPMTDTAPPADPPPRSPLQARYGERYRWYLLVSVMVGVMASIRSLALNTSSSTASPIIW